MNAIRQFSVPLLIQLWLVATCTITSSHMFEPGGHFVGIVDRSRLTTSLVLEIAKRIESP